MRLINRCPHLHLRGVYGDEINHTPGYRRIRCRDCGQALDGHVRIAETRRCDDESCTCGTARAHDRVTDGMCTASSERHRITAARSMKYRNTPTPRRN